ncbi:DEAD/DEAH box helicase [Thalassobacillus pellis]|uniref:DEAD/DEAH box helicase n=1 Tax=Thalassobacillus pellis TaxID=748008 RepID=UPI001EF7927F|nr:DEAD/DEAH box helicase [Thalassobacillus pellis]MBM7551439.1 competence protein ComFA [Thalassobacillus pellis]
MNKFISSIHDYFSPDLSWIPQQTIPQVTHVEKPLSHLLSGKLFLPYELPEESLSFINAHFTKVPAIEKHWWGYRCRRCGNQKKYLFAYMPCGDQGKKCLYCRKCIVMGRVSECTPLYLFVPSVQWEKVKEACVWKGRLTSFQADAAEKINEVMAKGSARLLVWAVCGAGKTEMIFPGLATAFAQGKRVCLATPRTDVVRELLPRFESAFPNVKIQALFGDSPVKQADAQFILATTHQLLRFARAFDVMVIDEVDAFPYHADVSLPFATRRAAKETAGIIYLTATPRPKQLKEIDSKKLPTVFVPRRFHGHPLPVPSFVGCFNLRSSLKQERLPEKVKAWLDKRGVVTRQLLIFVPTISDAALVERLLHATFSSITAVHASDPDRKEKIELFRNKVYEVLVTTTILERGVTFPSVDVIILDSGHTVFDQAALVQIAGRAGRSPTDPHGEVVFFHQGKTDAMEGAVEMIKRMNKRGRKIVDALH